jgi:hypothetical protein
VVNLEEELDRLYALEPSAFIAERDRLVRELRTAGEREKAEQVKQLRKPTVSAWTINQLARRERRDVDLLLDAGHRLLEAQQRLLAGEDPGRLDEARRTERDALAGLHKAARRVLAETGRGSETTLAQVMGTLQAAAVSSEGRELLARGRFTGELEAAGFELLVPLAGEESTLERPRQRKRATGKKQQREPDRKRLEEAQRRLREARETAKTTEKDLRAAERDAGTARREAARAEELLQKKQAAAAEAQTALERTEKELREARRKTR